MVAAVATESSAASTFAAEAETVAVETGTAVATVVTTGALGAVPGCSAVSPHHGIVSILVADAIPAATGSGGATPSGYWDLSLGWLYINFPLTTKLSRQNTSTNVRPSARTCAFEIRSTRKTMSATMASSSSSKSWTYLPFLITCYYFLLMIHVVWTSILNFLFN